LSTRYQGARKHYSVSVSGPSRSGWAGRWARELCQPLSALLSPREFQIGVLRCTAGHSPVSSGPPERVRTGRESGRATRQRPSQL